MTSRKSYGIAAAVTCVSVLVLIWLSLGVGIIGKDGDPANVMYFAVVGVGIAGALLARFRADGMARTLFAMALVQAAIAAVALIARLGEPWSGPLELSCLNGFFIVMFCGAAWLFRRGAIVDAEARAV